MTYNVFGGTLNLAQLLNCNLDISERNTHRVCYLNCTVNSADS